MTKKIFVLAIIMVMFAGILPAPVNAASTPPITLAAPQNLRAELKYDVEGVPYFELKLDIAQSVKDINQKVEENYEYYAGFSCAPVELRFEYRYANYGWNQGPSMVWNTDMDLSEFLGYGYFDYRPFDKGTDGVEIDAETYQFRAYLNLTWGYTDGWMDKDIKSSYSNIVTIGNPGYSARLYGANRTETAIAVSKEGWGTGADAVILTRNDNYPDALTGTPLSRKLDAPILFTNSKTLTKATETEIARLKPSKIVILGGTAAVSQEIENQLKSRYTVQRLGGKDRYETAEKIAVELGFKGKAVITTGLDFHDALIAAPMAAYNNMPILLTNPKALPTFTKDALAFINPTEITVVGNTSSVSEAVFAELNIAQRISGRDIYETSVLVAKHFEASTGRIFLATGKDFPDALSGSGLAAKFNSPILFVGDPLSQHVRQYLSDSKGQGPTINLLGGDAAISPAIKDAVDAIFE